MRGKRLLALILTLMMSLSLVACGGSEGQEPAGDNPQQEQEVGSNTPDESENESEKQPEKQLEPIVYTGSGDDVLDIGSIEDGYVFHISGNAAKDLFTVTGYDAADEQTALLACTTEKYDGVTADVSFTTVLLQIEAKGDWTVELVPLSDLPHYKQGDTVTGSGNMVFYATPVGKSADITGNDARDLFCVYAYGDEGGDLLVAETEPYDGKVLLQDDPYCFTVEAVGDWSIRFD